jgi:3-methyladenine DNA glycosylase AlkD
MTRPERLAAEIRAWCQANANPAGVNKYARYFKEGYDSWGLLDKDHPIWHQQQAAWLAAYRQMGVAGFLNAGEILFRSPKYEEGSLAIRFLAELREELDAASLAGIARWFEAGIRNWAHTDVLCGLIIGPLVAGGAAPLDALAEWRRAPHKFQRRAVPVAMLDLLKTGAEVKPLLAFVEPLMLDPAREVHQGVGWFLREAWKKQPEPVEAFLLKWKDRAPRLIFQYATEKMTAADRARFKRAKPAAGAKSS